MVSISQFRVAQKAIANKSSLVYSTATKAESKTTLFDAFCKSLLEKKSVAGLQEKAVAGLPSTEQEIKAAETKLREIANAIIQNSGTQKTVTAEVRVKGANSAAKKVKKSLREMQENGYDASRPRVLDFILYEGPVSLVNDGYGMRFIIEKYKTKGRKTSNLLFNELMNYHNQPASELKIMEVEDYFGRGIRPYAGKRNVNKLGDLTYVTPRGREDNVRSVSKIKDSGYTRTNINSYMYGKPGEGQIGGRLTTDWGNAEHWLYDKRQGKTLNFAECKTDEQKRIAMELDAEYGKLLKNKKLNKKYNDNYLNKIWAALVEAEEKNLATPNYPPLPEGIPEILSAENIMKLAHH